MTVLYTTIQNGGGQVFGKVSNNLDVIEKGFCKHAVEWLRLAVKDCEKEWYETEWVKQAPVLMRLSDRAVLCSTADVIPECLDAYNGFLEKKKSLEEGLSEADYVAGLKGVVAKMMEQDVDVQMETPYPASYAIVRDVADGDLEVCGPNRFILCNTLDGQKKEYAELALKWGLLAVKDGTVSPPVLMRLSDGAVLYSVMDFLPEMKSFVDEFVSKCDKAREELGLLKQDFDAKLESCLKKCIVRCNL